MQMGGLFLGPLSPLRAPPRRLLTRGCLPCVPTVASEMSLGRWTRARRPHWKRGPRGPGRACIHSGLHGLAPSHLASLLPLSSRPPRGGVSSGAGLDSLSGRVRPTLCRWGRRGLGAVAEPPCRCPGGPDSSGVGGPGLAPDGRNLGAPFTHLSCRGAGHPARSGGGQAACGHQGGIFALALATLWPLTLGQGLASLCLGFLSWQMGQGLIFKGADGTVPGHLGCDVNTIFQALAPGPALGIRGVREVALVLRASGLRPPLSLPRTAVGPGLPPRGSGPAEPPTPSLVGWGWLLQAPPPSSQAWVQERGAGPDAPVCVCSRG